MDWKKILSIIASLAPLFASYQDAMPMEFGIIGSAILGVAVAGKAVIDKRKTGAPIFRLKKAQDQVAKL